MKDYGGIPGTQTLLPVMISEGMNKRGLSLPRLIDVTSKNPAKRYGLYPKKGSIQKGSDADITLFSMDKEWKFDLDMLLSKGETSPFEGETFKGKVMMTILRGRIIYHESAGVTVDKGYGKYLC